MQLFVSQEAGENYYVAQMEQWMLVPGAQVWDSKFVFTCTQSERCGWNAEWAGEEGLAVF